MIAFLSCAALVIGITASNVFEDAAAHDCCCSNSFNGNFNLTIMKIDTHQEHQQKLVAKVDKHLNLSPTRSIYKHTYVAPKPITLNLQDGVLADIQGRAGCIYRIQPDEPSHVGYVSTSSWTICNDTLELRGQEVFYKCPSKHGDDRTFYNLYDRQWNAACEPYYLKVTLLNGSSENPSCERRLPTSGAPPAPKQPNIQIGNDQAQPIVGQEIHGEEFSGHGIGGQALDGGKTGDEGSAGDIPIPQDKRPIPQIKDDELQNLYNMPLSGAITPVETKSTTQCKNGISAGVEVPAILLFALGLGMVFFG